MDIIYLHRGTFVYQMLLESILFQAWPCPHARTQRFSHCHTHTRILEYPWSFADFLGNKHISWEITWKLKTVWVSEPRSLRFHVGNHLKLQMFSLSTNDVSMISGARRCRNSLMAWRRRRMKLGFWDFLPENNPENNNSETYGNKNMFVWLM